MTNKKLYSREEFENLRVESAEKMAADVSLTQAAFDLLDKAGSYYWVHQSTWFGEPILQVPQDMFALQEIIFNTRPKFIIEVGVAWGGSLLFYSTLMEVLGGERIIGIDVYIPDDLKARVGTFGRLADRITWLNGSSIDQDTVNQVKAIVGESREVMVVLDSYHTHEHVLQELELYTPLIGMGHYLVCADTVIEYLPKPEYRLREWGPGNNPKTALDQFLTENDRFVIDKARDNKLLITCNPRGYLLCVK